MLPTLQTISFEYIFSYTLVTFSIYTFTYMISISNTVMHSFLKYHLEYDKFRPINNSCRKNVHTQYQYIGCLFQARKMVFEFQISIL